MTVFMRRVRRRRRPDEGLLRRRHRAIRDAAEHLQGVRAYARARHVLHRLGDGDAQDAELDWKTKELLILKATQRSECQYCVVQHEPGLQRLGVTADTIVVLEGDNYKNRDLFTDGEKALLDLTVQIVIDANRASNDTWERWRNSKLSVGHHDHSGH
jgi:AhpD family alkylhydroperoxidase